MRLEPQSRRIYAWVFAYSLPIRRSDTAAALSDSEKARLSLVAFKRRSTEQLTAGADAAVQNSCGVMLPYITSPVMRPEQQQQQLREGTRPAAAAAADQRRRRSFVEQFYASSARCRLRAECARPPAVNRCRTGHPPSFGPHASTHALAAM